MRHSSMLRNTAAIVALTGGLLLAAASTASARETAAAAASSGKAGGTWTIPARTLPLPAASEAFRAYLGSKPQPKVQDVLNMTPRTPAQWKKLQQTLDAAVSANAVALAREMRAKVQPALIGGVKVHFITPREVAPENRGRLFVHIHGGAYVLNAGRASTPEGILIATRSRIPVLSIDYRMPPDHPFPAALDDVTKVWRAVMRFYDPQQVALGGTSAGAGLSMAALLHFRRQGLALPAALFLGTPWADLTQTGDSFFINEGIDGILVTWRGVLDAAGRLYANGRDLKDPLLSPVYGDLSGFPPTLLFTGTRDLFLSLTARTHRKLRDAGVPATIHVFEGLAHGEYNAPRTTPESLAAHRELAQFLRQNLKGGCAAPEKPFCGLRSIAKAPATEQ